MPESHTGPPSRRRAPPGRPTYGEPILEYRAAAKLARRVALVTASHAGVARAAALLFAREGADLALVFPEGEEDAARETL